VRELSKDMVTQLHLALVMAMDAKLLVLDEPTLRLDILYRKQFYDSLLNDYFDRSRTILVTTHQADEIQNTLLDVAGGSLHGQRGPGELRLCGVSMRVADLIKMTRTDGLLPMDEDVEASLKASG
jgi:ABC-type sulfate/molybdate transport systems ATPase subunit